MDRDATSKLAEEFAAALDWWREAGVDCAFADDPLSWLVQPAADPGPPAALPGRQRRATPSPPAIQAIGGDPAGWPGDLSGFVHWWLSEPSLDSGGANPRIAPRGSAGARLMVLVPQPERDDRESLLSGPQGRLLASFLDAAGIPASEAYLAAALPRHTPHPDWPMLARAGLGRIVFHHIAIARPGRLVLFGNDLRTLLGNDPAQNPSFLLDLNQPGGTVPALAARSLEHMLNIPSARSRFWRDWLDWTDG